MRLSLLRLFLLAAACAGFRLSPPSLSRPSLSRPRSAPAFAPALRRGSGQGGTGRGRGRGPSLGAEAPVFSRGLRLGHSPGYQDQPPDQPPGQHQAPLQALQERADLTRGVLPSGLEYLLLPAATPDGRVDAHLEILSGSADELDHQQGKCVLLKAGV
jgi:hypothetical protein